jgi:DNA-nicking Smr family endonuclease
MSSNRKRPLTAEEAELWHHVMRSTKALRHEGERSKQAVIEDDETPTIKRKFVEEKPSTLVSSIPTKPQKPAAHPPIAPFDERQRRKIGKSDLIDARIDLHGMRQREAYSALKNFLFCCAAGGKRHVLVITGKGRRRDEEETGDFFSRERGVLRRLVPQWLGQPELRSVVVSYTTSHIRHGGEGALYVHLRKSSRR